MNVVMLFGFFICYSTLNFNAFAHQAIMSQTVSENYAGDETDKYQNQPNTNVDVNIFVLIFIGFHNPSIILSQIRICFASILIDLFGITLIVKDFFCIISFYLQSDAIARLHL